MKTTRITFALLMTLSLIFSGQAQSKQHSSKKTRDRILKEIKQNNAYNAKRSSLYAYRQTKR